MARSSATDDFLAMMRIYSASDASLLVPSRTRLSLHVVYIANVLPYVA